MAAFNKIVYLNFLEVFHLLLSFILDKRVRTKLDSCLYHTHTLHPVSDVHPQNIVSGIAEFTAVWKQDSRCTYNVTLRRSCNHCCSGKAIGTCITYSECVSAALIIQHAMHVNHIVICGLPGSTLFFHFIH